LGVDRLFLLGYNLFRWFDMILLWLIRLIMLIDGRVIIIVVVGRYLESIFTLWQ